MAEEVKIVDVAGGPAAEATLQELLKVMKAQAGGSGGGGGTQSATKAQDLYTTAVTRGTKSRKANTKAVDKSTGALKKMANAASSLAGGVLSLFTQTISGAIGVATNLVKAFGDGTGTMTDMVSAIPGIGSILGMFTGYLDNTLTTFQQLSSSGASFNNNLTELRVSAANAKVSLETFASFVGENTENFAAMGGTVTQGIKAFQRQRNAFRAHEQELLNMGVTFEEMNEGLAHYMYLNRASAMTGQRNIQDQSAAAAGYLKNLNALAKLTGQDVKAQQEKIQAAQMEIAVQRKLASMTQGEREKFQLLMADAVAAGPDAVRALNQQLLGMPPLTEEMALFQTQFGETFGVLGRGLGDVFDSSVSRAEMEARATQRQLDIMEGNAAAADRLGTLLDAAAAGADGPMATLSEMFANSGLKFEQYYERLADGSIRFDRARAEAALLAAAEEQGATDDAVDALTSFRNTLREIKKQFEENIVAPITAAVGPQLNALATAFQNANSTTLAPFMERLGTIISDVTTDINQFGVAGALSNLMTRIGEAAKPVFSGMFDSLYRMIFGETEADMKERLGQTKSELKSQAAEIQAQIDALNTELPNLSGASAASAREQIAGLEQQLAHTNQQINNTQTELDGAQGSAGLFDGIFGGLWDTVSEMDWGTAAIALGVMTAAIVALGFAAKPVVVPLIAIGAAAAGIGVGASGIADLINSITNSVSNLADGVKKFEELDSGKLIDVGNALGPLTDNIMDLAQGGIVASFVGEGALEGLANGVRAFESVDAANLWPVGFAIKGLGDPIKEIAQAGFFANFVSDGALQGLAEGVKAFEGINATGLTAVGPALVSLQQGIAAFTGDGVLDSLSKGLGSLFSGLFGGDEGDQFDSLIEGLKKFEEVNTRAIYEVGQGLAGIADFAAGEVDLGEIQISTQGLENLNNITKSLDAEPIRRYNEALEKLVEVLTDLNEELGGQNAAGAAGTGTTASPAAGVLENMSGIGGDSGEKLDRLNMLVSQLVNLQTEGNRYTRGTMRAVNGNLQTGF